MPLDLATDGPRISVVVPSHDRPLRLRWLLNALQEQTLDRALWEVVVGHDSAGPETAELLRTHPLAQVPVLRPGGPRPRPRFPARLHGMEAGGVGHAGQRQARPAAKGETRL